MKKSIRSLVLHAVLKRGAVSIPQVLADMGGKIPLPAAITAGKRRLAYDQRRKKKPLRRRSISEIASLGRYVIVQEYLYHLMKDGKLSRARRGVYGPPLPKLFVPSKIA